MRVIGGSLITSGSAASYTRSVAADAVQKRQRNRGWPRPREGTSVAKVVGFRRGQPGREDAADLLSRPPGTLMNILVSTSHSNGSELAVNSR